MEESLDEKIDSMLKFVIVGDMSVGKTNLINRLVKDRFTTATAPTVGVEYLSQIVKHSNFTIKLLFFDTAGQEKYRSMCTVYYKDADGFIFVYDVTNRKSFENLSSWLDQAQQYKTKEVLMLLIGNKIDLKKQRVVTSEEGVEFSKANKMFFMEASALTNEGGCVKQAFEMLTTKALDNCVKNLDQYYKNEEEKIKKSAIQITNEKKCAC